MKRRTLMAIGTILLNGAVTGASPAQSQADSASVTAFYGEWFASLRQGPERYASFYAADGMVLPPNAAPAKGRAAIAEWLVKAQAAMTYTVRPEGIAVDEMRFLSPSWVVYRSTLRGQRIPKAGGEPVAFETKYMDLLHRTDAGRWEVVYRIYSDNR
jgi:ketosteroid isomerase-like protein